MSGPKSSSPRPFNGAVGNALSRTEPKVRASALVALLSAAVLYYVHRFVPVSVPGYLVGAGDALVTGALAWVAGYVTRAVDRVDLFLAPKLTVVGERAEEKLREVLGDRVADDMEEFVEAIRPDVASVAGAAWDGAVAGATAAVEAGVEPLAAARDAVRDTAGRAGAHAAGVIEAGVIEAGAATTVGQVVTAEIPVVLAGLGAGEAGEALAGKLRELADLVAAYRPGAEGPVPMVTRPPVPAAAGWPVAEPVAEPAAEPVAPAPVLAPPTGQPTVSLPVQRIGAEEG